jgi:hypothetical protein
MEFSTEERAREYIDACDGDVNTSSVCFSKIKAFCNDAKFQIPHQVTLCYQRDALSWCLRHFSHCDQAIGSYCHIQEHPLMSENCYCISSPINAKLVTYAPHCVDRICIRSGYKSMFMLKGQCPNPINCSSNITYEVKTYGKDRFDLSMLSTNTCIYEQVEESGGGRTILHRIGDVMGESWFYLPAIGVGGILITMLACFVGRIIRRRRGFVDVDGLLPAS